MENKSEQTIRTEGNTPPVEETTPKNLDSGLVPLAPPPDQGPPGDSPVSDAGSGQTDFLEEPKLLFRSGDGEPIFTHVDSSGKPLPPVETVGFEHTGYHPSESWELNVDLGSRGCI